MHATPNAPIEELQNYARQLGKFFTVIAALMSASAGWNLGGNSYLAAVLLCGLFGGLTVATAYMLNFVDLAWSAGERKIALGLAVAYAALCVGEYGSHTAFGTSHRAANIETATLQNTRYDDGRSMIADTDAQIKLWTARLAQLEAQNAWTTTVNAEALRAEEEKERRRGGCGPRCLEIQGKIAIAEETGKLRKQIEASKAVLADLRTKSATTEKGESIALNQSALFATIATGSLAPTPQALAWANIGIGAYVSLLSTFLGTIFNWLGFHQFRRKAETRAEDHQADIAPPATVAKADTRPSVLKTHTIAQLRSLAA